MVGLLVVVRLGLISLIVVVVVVAGGRETGGLEVVGVDFAWSAELSILRESSSLLLLLNTVAAVTSHVGIFHFGIAAGCCVTDVGVGVLIVALLCCSTCFARPRVGVVVGRSVGFDCGDGCDFCWCISCCGDTVVLFLMRAGKGLALFAVCLTILRISSFWVVCG